MHPATCTDQCEVVTCTLFLFNQASLKTNPGIHDLTNLLQDIYMTNKHFIK